MSADSFPPQQAEGGEEETLSLKGSILKRLIEEVSFSVCQDDNRYGLNGAHIEELSDANRVRLVTTDGSRLSFSESEYEGTFSMGRRMLLPRKAQHLKSRKPCFYENPTPKE